MTFNPKKFNPALSLFMLLLLSISCKKEKSSTVNIDISGRAYVKTTNMPLANVPVQIRFWPQNATGGDCLACNSIYKIGEGTTGIDGRFSINVPLDTNSFNGGRLYIYAASDTNYISKTEVRPFISQFFYQFDGNALKNIDLPFYPKTYLTIRLHRTLSDNFYRFTVGHYFDQGYDDYSDYSFLQHESRDTSIKVLTTTDLYTSVKWQKEITFGATQVKTDSLICPANGTAVFDINY